MPRDETVFLLDMLHAAHYPSWGSKTRDGIVFIRSTFSFSLPLMGIENVCILPKPELMTPAHYPSWGSKTFCPSSW